MYNIKKRESKIKILKTLKITKWICSKNLWRLPRDKLFPKCWCKADLSVLLCLLLLMASLTALTLYSGDALVLCLEGVGKVEIDGKPYLLHEFEGVVMSLNYLCAVLCGGRFQNDLRLCFRIINLRVGIVLLQLVLQKLV